MVGQADGGLAHALIDAGWDGGWNVPGGAYESVQYQNANHSVRVTDEFMRAVEKGEKWPTYSVTEGTPVDFHDAKALFRLAAENAHFCGDPGMQFDTTINDWHTCPESGRINSSNPCAEYMHLDNTACNLASINLRTFERPANGAGWFDVDGFAHAVRLMIVAQDIMVDAASYPTEAIGAGARKFRQLGLGYSNLGGLLMSKGIPYDSDDGRRTAGLITDLMQATAYRTSSELSRLLGPFDGYGPNAEAMARVIEKHAEAHRKIQGAVQRSHISRT